MEEEFGRLKRRTFIALILIERIWLVQSLRRRVEITEGSPVDCIV
jgi:hypothetical protein